MSKKLLFVCLGNICRSPAGEAVMKSLVKERGLEKKIACDSAGTAAYHVGSKADSRMRKHGSQRGYQLTSIARQFDPSTDFDRFDYILAMDEDNYHNILSTDSTGKYHNKVHRMVDFCQRIKSSHVPDPYYGGAEGFEEVLDILEDSCGNLLDQLEGELQ